MNSKMNHFATSETQSPSSKKQPPLKSILMLVSGLAVGLSLSSCVDPSFNPYGNNRYNSPYSTGHRIQSLPSGYRTENISGRTYYYHDGHYYQSNSGGYAVVTAPRTSRYYTEYNRYRQPNSSDPRRREDSYNRNDPRYDQRYDRNPFVSRLPSGYRVINHRGNTYYEAGGRYYVRQSNGYLIVKRPY